MLNEWNWVAASIKSFTFELRREWLYVSRPVNLFSLLPSINPSINFNLFNQLSFLLFKDSCCPREPKWKQFKNCWNGVGPRERSLRLITNNKSNLTSLLQSNQTNAATALFDGWRKKSSRRREEEPHPSLRLFRHFFLNKTPPGIPLPIHCVHSSRLHSALSAHAAPASFN